MQLKRVFKTAFILSSTFVLACGVKGSPKPPLTDAPATVKEINIKQQGEQLVIYWKYTPRYADGRSMAEKFTFEVFSLGHRIVKNIQSEGNLYWFRYPFKSDREYCFRIKVKTEKSESKFSKYFCYIPTFNYPREIPYPQFSLTPDGIKIMWDNTGLKANIYKSKKKVYIPVSYVSLVGENSFLDKQVSSGVKYCYYMTYENNNGVESNPSYLKCILFRDIFPPEPPKNPEIIRKGNDYYLIWSESPSKDVKGYFIYINGKQINKIPLKTYSIKLKGYDGKGKVEVRAVDRNGNLSPPTTAEMSSELP
ncbi:MAG: hypothetical protein GXO45_01250 [Aquificae bacterium]|nr:hypothetical protein [Aquificota bacterium]